MEPLNTKSLGEFLRALKEAKGLKWREVLAGVPDFYGGDRRYIHKIASKQRPVGRVPLIHLLKNGYGERRVDVINHGLALAGFELLSSAEQSSRGLRHSSPIQLTDTGCYIDCRELTLTRASVVVQLAGQLVQANDDPSVRLPAAVVPAVLYNCFCKVDPDPWVELADCPPKPAAEKWSQVKMGALPFRPARCGSEFDHRVRFRITDVSGKELCCPVGWLGMRCSGDRSRFRMDWMVIDELFVGPMAIESPVSAEQLCAAPKLRHCNGAGFFSNRPNKPVKLFADEPSPLAPRLW